MKCSPCVPLTFLANVIAKLLPKLELSIDCGFAFVHAILLQVTASVHGLHQESVGWYSRWREDRFPGRFTAELVQWVIRRRFSRSKLTMKTSLCCRHCV